MVRWFPIPIHQVHILQTKTTTAKQCNLPQDIVWTPRLPACVPFQTIHALPVLNIQQKFPYHVPMPNSRWRAQESPKSYCNIKWHLYRQHQGIQATRKIMLIEKFPTNILPVVPIQQWNNIYSGCSPVTGRVHSDQTGWLIAPSIQLMNYILKVYNEDFNEIFAEPMRNHSGSEHQEAYQKILYKMME